MNYHYVGLDDKFMSIAYTYAKNLYLGYGWNKKSIPVAIIIKNGNYVAKGICSNGLHAIEKKCNRLGMSGTDYSNCPHCSEEQHAERIALKESYDKDLNGAEIYVYGHYKLCTKCIEALNERGITTCYLLENSDVLFDRHNKDTVIGTERQFAL